MNKWIYTILLVGLLAISTSPVIARLLPLVPAAVIAFWRMAAASAMLWSYSSIRPQESRLQQKISDLFLPLVFYWQCTLFSGSVL